IEGDWGISKTISITISYRTIGTYNYSIEINDGYGGSDLDWVLVTITEPTDIDLFNLIIALGIVGIAFLIVGIIWKKA
ncbi:MAG: hypothetical protein GY870_13515, partial [archaeon]|nr:hypothetical protein [archaeon]